MDTTHYDVLLAGQTECRCDCGVTMWPGEVVFIDRSPPVTVTYRHANAGPTKGIVAPRLRCLHCAVKAGAPPVPVEVAARALSEGAEHLKHAKMCGLRERTIAHRVKVDGTREARAAIQAAVDSAIAERMSTLTGPPATPPVRDVSPPERRV